MTKIFSNIFYNDEPKYISLTHPYISQCRKTASPFLIQIVAPKTFEDIITSYSNFLFSMQKKKKVPFLLAHLYTTKFLGTTSPLAHPDLPLLKAQCIGDLHMVVQVWRIDQSCQLTDAMGCWQSQDRAQFCWFPSTWGRWRNTNKPVREETNLCNTEMFCMESAMHALSLWGPIDAETLTDGTCLQLIHTNYNYMVDVKKQVI